MLYYARLQCVHIGARFAGATLGINFLYTQISCDKILSLYVQYTSTITAHLQFSCSYSRIHNMIYRDLYINI